MDKLEIPVTAIVEHLLISWIPWLIGVVVGGGVGLLCARGMRALFSAKPAWRYPSALLPWRTLVMMFLMAAWSPLIVILLGLGPVAGGVMVGSSVCILAMAFTATTLVENWYPSPFVVRLIGGARTLVVVSCLIAAGVGQIGGGGLGFYLRLAPWLLAGKLLWQVVLVVVIAAALVLDLALGLAQLIALRSSGDNGEPATVEGIAA